MGYVEPQTGAPIRLRRSGVQEAKNDKSTDSIGMKHTVSSISSLTRNGTYTTAQFSVEEQWRHIYARDDGPLSYVQANS